MANLSLKLPLHYDLRLGGYGMHTSFKNLVQQNLKHLILTAPGERMMLPTFGVGLRNFLFLSEANAKNLIREKLQKQVVMFMPYIELRQIKFYNSPDPNIEFNNFLGLSIKYFVDPISQNDALDVSVVAS